MPQRKENSPEPGCGFGAVKSGLVVTGLGPAPARIQRAATPWPSTGPNRNCSFKCRGPSVGFPRWFDRSRRTPLRSIAISPKPSAIERGRLRGLSPQSTIPSGFPRPPGRINNLPTVTEELLHALSEITNPHEPARDIRDRSHCIHHSCAGGAKWDRQLHHKFRDEGPLIAHARPRPRPHHQALSRAPVRKL